MRESLVRVIELDENVGGGKGALTSVSVLEPCIRIERTTSHEYRIIVFFKLQVKIHAFEKGYMEKFEKFFDSISLRYLFMDGEKHKVKPLGDNMVADIVVSDAKMNSKSLDVGMNASIPTGSVTPSVGAHIQHDNTITYEHHTNSWKRGLSFETYARKRSPVRGWPGKTYRRKPKNHFQAYKKHTQTCTCFHSSGAADGCIRRCKISYDRCAHWYWQTEAEANLWTPEIYETFVFPITITRIVPVAKIDQAQAETSQHSLLQYLHFAFVVKTRLRELGWRWQDYLRLKRSTKPAEARFKNSFGYPLASDRVTFCIWCCPSRILEGWPKYPTRYIQDEVDQEVIKHGPILRRALTDREYDKKGREERESKRESRHRAQTLDDQTVQHRKAGSPEKNMPPSGNHNHYQNVHGYGPSYHDRCLHCSSLDGGRLVPEFCHHTSRDGPSRASPEREYSRSRLDRSPRSYRYVTHAEDRQHYEQSPDEITEESPRGRRRSAWNSIHFRHSTSPDWVEVHRTHSEVRQSPWSTESTRLRRDQLGHVEMGPRSISPDSFSPNRGRHFERSWGTTPGRERSPIHRESTEYIEVASVLRSPEVAPRRGESFGHVHSHARPASPGRRRASTDSIRSPFEDTSMRQTTTNRYPQPSYRDSPVIPNVAEIGLDTLKQQKECMENEEMKWKAKLELEEKRKNIKRIQRKLARHDSYGADSDTTIELSLRNEEGTATVKLNETDRQNPVEIHPAQTETYEDRSNASDVHFNRESQTSGQDSFVRSGRRPSEDPWSHHHGPHHHGPHHRIEARRSVSHRQDRRGSSIETHRRTSERSPKRVIIQHRHHSHGLGGRSGRRLSF